MHTFKIRIRLKHNNKKSIDLCDDPLGVSYFLKLVFLFAKFAILTLFYTEFFQEFLYFVYKAQGKV